jgi:hypothetical protein
MGKQARVACYVKFMHSLYDFVICQNVYMYDLADQLCTRTREMCGTCIARRFPPARVRTAQRVW